MAVVASVEGDQEKFVGYRNQIIDTQNSLSNLIDIMTEAKVTVPETFAEWVENLDKVKNDLALATNSCSKLTSGVYTWTELSGALSVLINLNEVWINETKYPDFNKDQAGDLMGGDNVITFGPGSGVFADVADFTGNISTMVSTMLGNVEITTSTLQKPVYLSALYESVKTLEPAGDATGTQSVTLSNTYGYALDLAFRCSSETELLLQTAGTQRIYEDSNALATQGGGSYMEFAVTESVSQTILMLDAVRVGFIDDAGKLLGVAKLNTSNRETSGSVVKAPLYLYDFSFSDEDGSMVMGERKKTDNAITSLQKNVAKAVTVVVWLDGDLVDNTMVSGDAETSMSGMLNLQFASSADLVPARNTDLLNITTNPADLVAKVAEEKATYEAGQLYYSSVTWNAFTAAYNQAVAVSENNSSTDSQIWNAFSELKTTKNALDAPSHGELQDMIDDVREIMGYTVDRVSIALKNEAGNYSVAYEYTMEQFDNRIKTADVFHVDYSKNLRNEGNGLSSRIYTDESWNVLAGVLYRAEQLNHDEFATDAQINDMMTALDAAYDALVPGAYFFPYDYAGTLYYYAVPQNANDDTYGKWYDNQFQRIISDKTILDLDAHAEPAQVAQIDIGKYVTWDTATAVANVELLDKMYPTLKNDEIIGLKMVRDSSYFFGDVMNQNHTDALNALIKTVTDEALDVDVSPAREILERVTRTAAEEAQSVIDRLAADVESALAVKNPAEPVVELMSADQITVLTKAVSDAQAVIGAYNPGVDEQGNPNPEDPKITSLKEASSAVTALLNYEGDVTAEQADTALNMLNERLVANGKKEVTIYNTIVHAIPTVEDVTEIAYTKEYPLFLSGKTGVTTLSVTGVTKMGVVFTASVDVNIYTAAERAEIDDSVVEVEEGSALNLDAALKWADNRSRVEIALGNVVVTTPDAEKPEINTFESATTPEIARNFIWASSDVEIATVTGGSVEGVKPGTVTISVSIETDAGNTYTDSITITVTPKPAEPEVTEPSDPEVTDPSEPENP